jgi:adenosine deaminase CECR1
MLSSHRLSICLTITLIASAGLRAASFEKRFEAIWEAATPKQRYTLLYDLPKGGDIHNHSPGSNRPEWMLAIAKDPERCGGDTFWTRMNFSSPMDAIAPIAFCHTIRNLSYELLPPESQAEYLRLDQLTPEQEKIWADAFRLEADGEGRTEFFDVIWTRLGDVLNNPHLRLELMADNMKAFAAEGLSYWEPQFGPQDLYTNTGEPISITEGVKMIEERLAQPDLVATGMEARFQKTILRFHPQAEQIARDLYAFVHEYKGRWVGLNMAGIEEKGQGYPERFTDVLRELRVIYPTMPLAFHAGEMDGPDRNIRETLLLGATRIGHGLNILGDPDTLLLLQMSDRVLIETNLISNQLLEYVSDMSKHPFPELLRTGVPTCLTTDDRGIWDSNMTDEYYTAMLHYNLSWPELISLARNSLQYAFVETPVKEKLLKEYEERIQRFEERYAGGSIESAFKKLDNVTPVTYGYAQDSWDLKFD